MNVKVRNYVLPITFIYKGWEVTLNDASSFFQTSDVKVKVNIRVNRQPYLIMLANLLQIRSLLRQRNSSGLFNESNNSTQKPEKTNDIFQVVNDFFYTKKTVEYIEKANGGMLDRFLGQNLSGIEKVEQKVKNYIDSNLGTADFKDEFLEYLKQKGY